MISYIIFFVKRESGQCDRPLSRNLMRCKNHTAVSVGNEATILLCLHFRNNTPWDGDNNNAIAKIAPATQIMLPDIDASSIRAT